MGRDLVKSFYMIVEIKYIRHYRNKNITALKKVSAIDKTHALSVFKSWVFNKYKKALRIEIMTL